MTAELEKMDNYVLVLDKLRALVAAANKVYELHFKEQQQQGQVYKENALNSESSMRRIQGRRKSVLSARMFSCQCIYLRWCKASCATHWSYENFWLHFAIQKNE